MNERLTSLPQSLATKLRAIRRRAFALTLLRGGALTLAVLLGAMLAAMLIDWIAGWFDERARYAITLLALALPPLPPPAGRASPGPPSHPGSYRAHRGPDHAAARRTLVHRHRVGPEPGRARRARLRNHDPTGHPRGGVGERQHRPGDGRVRPAAVSGGPAGWPQRRGCWRSSSRSVSPMPGGCCSASGCRGRIFR